MIRAIIIEDEVDSQALLRTLLTKHCEGIEVVAVTENVRGGVEAINKLNPDLVFLDIDLPQENGFHLFKYFEIVDFNVIFTTAHDEYAIKAFRFSALDYLFKPINLKELRESIEKFKKQNKEILYNNIKIQTLQDNLNNRLQKIALPVINGLIFIDIKEIIRLEADNNYTIIYTTSGKEVISKTLGNFEKMLKTEGFSRINRSHLINRQFLKRYIRNKTPSIELTDGTQLRVSSGKKEAFLNEIGQR